MAEASVTIGNRRRWQVRSLAPWVAGAMIGAAAAALFLQPAHSHVGRASLASLVATSGGDARTIEPRLGGGFSWAPYRPAVRGAAADPELALAIRSTLARVREGAGDSDRRAAGVAHLLAGRHREALAMLAAAERGSDPLLWSDYAAAKYAAALRYDSPELLADALAAADAALSISPNLAEALFNRALILERLGLRDDGREAWNRYLLHESDAGWAAEGRAHLAGLAPVQSFADALDRDSDRLTADPEAARALARSLPEGARTQGLIKVLGSWAEDPRDADRHLRLARVLGSELAQGNGDRMLERAVAAIDRANETARRDLAAAHRDYRTGIKTYWRNEAGAAEPILQRAVAALERNGSPLALLARFYLANAVFDHGRREEACASLELLLPEVPADYPATRAHVLSQLGACRFARARWGESMTLLAESAAIFDRLGEISNASAVRRLIAAIYDRTGDREKAWQVRMLALRGIGRESNLRLEKAIATIAHEAILRRNWRTAAAFLNVELEVGRRIADDVNLAESLALRAAVRQRMNDLPGAQDDLANARAVTARVRDEAHREYLGHEQEVVAARLTPSPAEATALFTSAIAFETARSDRMNLPGLYLERARALRRGGDLAGAAADLRRGIENLEQSRESLPQGEARWGAFHAAEELFEEAIDLSLETGDVAAAFAVAEKARARSLLESYGTPQSADRLRLPRGTVVVEYAALPERLVIFTADASGARAVAVPVDRETLANEVETLLRALQSDSTGARPAAAALYRRLIEPVAAQLPGASRVVFVPDAATSAIPFAALVDRQGRYLIESHALVVAPSAAVFNTAEKRRSDAPPAPRSALIISNAAAIADSPSLAFVDEEARQIARTYPRSIEVHDAAELRQHAAAADVIHFAGHAIGDPSGLEPASIVLQKDGREHRLGVSEVAALPLRRTSVVVLAGCSTARGQRRGLEGVISVAHGFLTAGAPSVIATLWMIDDNAAAEAFPRLHTALAQGLPPAEALRAVQLESIRRGNVPPSFWAALQLIGS